MNTHLRPVALGHLRSFLAVARLLSFSEAAQTLCLTQSAVSRQISLFETSLGLKLFERHTRSVALTRDGRKLLKATEAAVELLDNTVDQLRSGARRKQLVISTWASFASQWLIPKLDSFRETHPDVDIQIQTTDAFVDPGKDGVDFSIRWATQAAVPPKALRLFGERLAPAASPHLLAQHPPLHTARSLLAHTLIESGAPANLEQSNWITWRKWLELNGLKQPEPKNWLQLSHADQGIQAAKRSQGIVLARLPLILDALKNGELVEVLPSKQITLHQAYWLIPPSNRTLTAAHQGFMAWLVEQALVTQLAMGEEP